MKLFYYPFIISINVIFLEKEQSKSPLRDFLILFPFRFNYFIILIIFKTWIRSDIRYISSRKI